MPAVSWPRGKSAATAANYMTVEPRTSSTQRKQNGPTTKDDPTSKDLIASWGLAWLRKSGRCRQFSNLEPRKGEVSKNPHKHYEKAQTKQTAYVTYKEVDA
jgi:hypothetical protein